MGLAFVPLALAPPGAPAAVLTALVTAVALLAAGSAVVHPFAMDTVVTLSGNRLVATHYGLYNTVSGLGITLGNLATGALWDFATRHDALWLAWCTLTATGLVCAASVATLARSGRRPGRRGTAGHLQRCSPTGVLPPSTEALCTEPCATPPSWPPYDPRSP